MNEPMSENYKPFAFDQLEHKTIDYLETIRNEAREIAERTKQEIETLKVQKEQELLALKSQIDEDYKELEKHQIELELRKKQLEEQERQIDQKTFEESRQHGFQKGFEEGKNEGIEQGKQLIQSEIEQHLKAELEKRLDESMQNLLPSLHKINEELLDVRQSLINFWEGNILQISAAIAYQAIMTELPKIKNIPLKLLQEALDLCVGNTSIKIRMNPQNINDLKNQIEIMLREISKVTSAEVIADSNITLGGCVIETPQGTINQQIESRLERIISELSEVYVKP